MRGICGEAGAWKKTRQGMVVEVMSKVAMTESSG